MQTFMNAFVGNLSSGPIDTTNTYSQALVPMAKVPWIREAHLLGRLYPSGGWRCPDGPESDMEDNSGSEIKVDVESDTGDDGESETKPDVKSETKVNADSETKVDTKGETNNVTKTETDIDSKTKINLDITNVDINSGRKAHIETETNPISQVTATVSEIDPSDDEGTGMEIDPHAKVNIEVGTEVEDDEENEADSLASIPWSVDSAATQPMPGDRYEMGPTKKGYGWLVIVECTKVPTESPGLAPVPKEARPEPPKRRDRRFPPPVPRPLALVRRQG
ncbi:hypothetical protein GQ43DRAFT_145772 [Delitschia confertaspora ATCC 74209]|uniref:Uncharacterized protein n=1 Tax=Delitschia confertaspora ATCC 74209 TaxID=1513339 RepID=A0A9P4JIK2_9PLEO|nr:hypothetical protein GQ43DRAFT_145772 [Delitschia confertaspora ATCC 74209]